MNRCAYSLLQLRPDPEREEGLNVAVAVVHAPNTIEVQEVSPQQLSEVLRRLNLSGAQFDSLALGLRMFVKRLRRLDDCTPEGLEAFASKEAGRFVLLPPHPTVPDDAKTIAARIFRMYVQPRPVGAEQGVALHAAPLNLLPVSHSNMVSRTMSVSATADTLVINPMPPPQGALHG